MGAKEIVVSTNVPTRRDGLPYADAREPADPGVAVYFTHGKRQLVIACDSYSTVRANMRAVGATVEALRAIQRHGATSLLERAFTGFAALPPKGGGDVPGRRSSACSRAPRSSRRRQRIVSSRGVTTRTPAATRRRWRGSTAPTSRPRRLPMMLAILLAASFAGCGVERGAVKNLLDRPALSAARPATVEQLLTLRAPKWSKYAPRRASSARSSSSTSRSSRSRASRTATSTSSSAARPAGDDRGAADAGVRAGRSPYAAQMAARRRSNVPPPGARGVQRMRLTGVIFFDKSDARADRRRLERRRAAPRAEGGGAAVRRWASSTRPTRMARPSTSPAPPRCCTRRCARSTSAATRADADAADEAAAGLAQGRSDKAAEMSIRYERGTGRRATTSASRS
jgi:hypothetical protein